MNLSITSRKKVYAAKERANIDIKLTDLYNRNISNANLNILVEGPEGFKTSLNKSTNYYGKSSLYIRPDASMAEGIYTITIEANSYYYGKVKETY